MEMIFKAKICMILNNPFRPDPRVLKEAVSLVQAGYDVTVHAHWSEGQPLIEKLNGFTVKRLKLTGIPWRWSRRGHVRFTKIAQFYASQLLIPLRERADIYHCHELKTLHLGLLFMAVSAILNLPRRLLFKKLEKLSPILIYDCHEYYPESYAGRNNRSPEQFQRALQKFARHERWLAKRADCVITVNEDLAGRFRSFHPHVAVIPNYPLEHLFTPVQGDNALLQRYADRKIVIYAGGLNSERGIDQTLQVLHQVKKQLPEVLGIFLGKPVNDAYGRQLEQQVAELGLRDHVEFPGWVPHKQVNAYLQLAKVGVFLLQPVNPRYDNTEPTKLFEYMASGLPVLVSDLPAMRRIVEQHQCGVVVAPQDVEGTARQLIALLRDEKRLQTMGTNGKSAFLREYTWQRCEQSLLAVYNKLLSKSTTMTPDA